MDLAEPVRVEKKHFEKKPAEQTRSELTRAEPAWVEQAWIEQKAILRELLSAVIPDHRCHSRLLNSIALMEHCGARKIGGYQKWGRNSTEVLRHAFEESRHAYFFRKQIDLLPEQRAENFASDNLLAPVASRQYLRKLDLAVCRYLKSQEFFEDHEKGLDLAYGWTKEWAKLIIPRTSSSPPTTAAPWHPKALP